MVLDFDVKTFCQNLKATKPPYKCPFDSCGKVYKSFSGIHFHLFNFYHKDDNAPSPPDSPTSKSPDSCRKKQKWHHRANRRSPTPPEFFRSPTRETLTYADSQRLVEVDVDGRLHRINIYEPLEIISQDEIDNQNNIEKEETAEKPTPKPVKAESTKVRKENTGASHTTTKLPEAQYKVIEDYQEPQELPERPASYYRYFEKSVDELDEEVEYDMDEEDHAWLGLLNEQRKSSSLHSISQEVFEIVMDRFEKEAFFQSQTSGKDPNPSIDEDAVCSICMDGECQNSNVILFCDMCNLAVHQECYGVPYIPEGQWLCRRCLQSPSRAVDCCLCPNKGGAFKQTDDNRWAHVVCSLWIPEVGFANTVFLEPVDSIEHIPAARWKLTCYICKQRGTGACIQCHKTNCYTAFHVTCAQQAGLFMKIEPVREPSATGTALSVRKTAYCDVHTPADSECTPMLTSDENEDKTLSAKKAKAKSRIKMRKARKILAEKRNALPVVSIPIIPEQRISKIAALVNIPKKHQFLSRLLSYWTLKRQSRNGVPLLRRLQSNHMTRNKEQTKNDKQSDALRAQLKYWQRLRQDLEKARLLVEQIRKREKLKREQLKLHQLAKEMQLQPFVILLRDALDQIQERDPNGIFAEPVSLEEVPDYLEYIETPMDFTTMRKRVEGHQYKTIEDFEVDFDLLVNNCMVYNAKDTMFYRAAVRLREQGGAIIRATRRMAERVGYDPDTGLHLTEPPQNCRNDPVILEDFDSFIQKDLKEGMPLEEQLRILLDKMDTANMVLKGGKRSRVAKTIKKEIIKVRRKLALQKGHSLSDIEENCGMDTGSTNSDSQPQSPSKPGGPTSPKSPPPVLQLAVEKSSQKSGTKGTPGRPRGRGRGRLKSRSESESEGQHKPDAGRGVASSSQTSDGKDSSTPPVGVNRRTAVLFSNKGPRKSQPSTTNTPARRGPGRPPGRPPKAKVPLPELQQDSDSAQPTSPLPSPSRRGTGASGMVGRKRSASATTGPSSPESRHSPPKRTLSLNDPLSGPRSPRSPRSPPTGQPSLPSFLIYRTDRSVDSSDSDSTSDLSSSDGSLSDSSSGSSSINSRSGFFSPHAEGRYSEGSSPTIGSALLTRKAAVSHTNTQAQQLNDPASANTRSAGLKPASPCCDSQSSSMSVLSRVSTGGSHEQWERCDSQTLGPPNSIDTADKIRKGRPESILMDGIKRMHSWPKVEAVDGGTNKGAKTTGQVAICGMGAVLVQPHPEAITGESSIEILKAGQIHSGHSLRPGATRSPVFTPVTRDSGSPSTAWRPSVGISESPERSPGSMHQTVSEAQRKRNKALKYKSPSSSHKFCPATRQYPTRSNCPVKITSLKPVENTSNIVLDNDCCNMQERNRSVGRNLRSKVSETIHKPETNFSSKGVFPFVSKLADLPSERNLRDKSQGIVTDLFSDVITDELRKEVRRRPILERKTLYKLKPTLSKHMPVEAAWRWPVCNKNLGSLGKISQKASISSNEQWKGNNLKWRKYKGGNSCRDNREQQSDKFSGSARARRSTSCDSEDIIPLEPLDLVWAKCRGYPWYPALIINPKMPKTGYFHNGVPIPVPPDEVLNLQRRYDEPVYLVLFFDTKRTWQWLPRNKLEPLGVDSGLDKAKLLENRKPNVRKAVRKAYEKAILHRCSVTGEPNPLSGESSTED
ncbi:peregrin-like isoform X2 [Liolophura sinensis]|uniref:peregrin-like isoform X2 n=1 Tax=Liolophura sinensis TaxID=3198878 RepID=UPI0031584D34